MSLSIETGGCFLDKGITVAVFHSFGSTPSLRELLNIAVTGAARRCEHSFNAHGGIFRRTRSYVHFDVIKCQVSVTHINGEFIWQWFFNVKGLKNLTRSIHSYG